MDKINKEDRLLYLAWLDYLYFLNNKTPKDKPIDITPSNP